MIIKLYIFTIIYFLLSVASLTVRFVNYASKKEGLKVGKARVFLWTIACNVNLRMLLIALMPIVNIIFAMLFIFMPDDALADIYSESVEKIKEEK